MDRITLYSYDPKNLEQIVETISLMRQSINSINKRVILSEGRAYWLRER